MYAKKILLVGSNNNGIVRIFTVSRSCLEIRKEKELVSKYIRLHFGDSSFCDRIKGCLEGTSDLVSSQSFNAQVSLLSLSIFDVLFLFAFLCVKSDFRIPWIRNYAYILLLFQSESSSSSLSTSDFSDSDTEESGKLRVLARKNFVAFYRLQQLLN